MRHLTDEELAKYFDDGTQDQRPDAPAQSGWSLDDAFANPKQGRKASRESTPVMQTSAPIDQPAIVKSRAHTLPPLSDDLTWTGRDVQPSTSSGFGKTPFLFIAALGGLALIIVMVGGGDTGSNLPQIGR